jgi:hypothetical protein
VNKTIAILCALCALPAVAQESRYVTFKTVNDKWGTTEHQVDRHTIKQEGAYQTFWSRVWKPADRQPVALSSSGRLYMWSQKFAVDCVHHRFAGQFIDSTDTGETRKKADLQTVRWTGLKKNPAVNRAVCGGK